MPSDNKFEIVVDLIDKVTPGLGLIGKGLLGLGGGLITGGIAATGVAVSGLTAGLGLAVSEAMEAEENLAQLNAVIASTGGAAGVSAEMATDLADSLSLVSRYSDDAIIEGENMLLTFTNLSQDVFPDVTQTMVDMSTALGQDLTASAMQLGKALQNPVDGAAALKRVGVNVTDEMINMLKAIMGDNEALDKMSKDAAKASKSLTPLNNDITIATQKLKEMEASGKASESQLMSERAKIQEATEKLEYAHAAIEQYNRAKAEWESGMYKGMTEEQRLMEAQKVLLGELQTEFGGSAEAAGKTFAGQLDILKNTMSNVAEEAGTVLLPILTTSLQSIAPILIDLAKNFAAFVSSDQFKGWLTETATFVQSQLLPAIMAFADFAKTYLLPAFVDFVSWMSANLFPALQMLFEWIATNIPPAMQAFAAFWTQTLIPAVKAFWEFIKPFVTSVVEFFTKTIPNAIAQLRNLWESDFMGISSFVKGFFEQIQLIFKLWQAAFSGDWYKFGQILREIVSNGWNTIVGVIKGLLGTIKTLFIKTDWAALGKAILQGIADGLGAFVGILRDAAINAAKAALDAMKGFLGIQSPSKVMEKQVGFQMAAGIKKGLMSGLAGMSTSVTTGLSAFVPAMAAAVSVAAPVGAPVGGGVAAQVIINYQPTISFADEYELEHRLKPVIERAMRRR